MRNMICLKDIKHIIWDYNGTLLNDIDLCVEMINIVLSRRELATITKQHYKEVFDFPVKDYYEIIGFDFNKEPFDVVGTEFIEEYNNNTNRFILHDGVLEILEKIKNLGIEQSVLSARLQESLHQELNDFGINKYFEHTFGLSDHYANGKSELGKQLMNRIEEAPENILLIGDTLHDMEVARALGIQELLISNGHQNYERLSKGSNNVLSSVNEFLKLIQAGKCIEF